ncbi:MAG TPA: ribosome maturation factor RimP [Ruminococcaceae bacterium]|nr:ribosome maturation factor RimP [Oscillospiraceae bacterium]
MANTAQTVFRLIADAVKAQGVDLWDVAFVKEGASRYLRVFIDKPGGVDINDCTNVSHAIDPIIDEADPIDESYYLEVSSPGLNRELKRKEHFTAFIGSKIALKLYKPFDGKKQISGVLVDYLEGPVLETEDKKRLSFSPEQISKASLIEDF